MQLSEHPTVKQIRAREVTDAARPRPESFDRGWLRQLCLEAGADDAGFVEIDRPEIADQRSEILSLLPGTKTVVSLVMRMNRENIRSPASTALSSTPGTALISISSRSWISAMCISPST